MHEREEQAFSENTDLFSKRDPRHYPLGCLTTGMGSDPVLQWFRHRAELSAYLWRVEPQRWGVHQGELSVLREKTEEIFIRMDALGPTEALREAHNALTRPYFEIAWWGEFGELCNGSAEWPRTLRRRFHGSAPDQEVPDVAEGQIEGFIAFLHARYSPPPVMSQP